MNISDAAPYAHAALEFLGGSVVVYQTLSRSVVAAAPRLVDVALNRAFGHPRVKAALVKYRPQIEAFFDAADAQIKKRLDAEAAAVQTQR